MPKIITPAAIDVQVSSVVTTNVSLRIIIHYILNRSNLEINLPIQIMVELIERRVCYNVPEANSQREENLRYGCIPNLV